MPFSWDSKSFFHLHVQASPNIVTSCSHYKTPRLHLGTNIMPQMRSPPAWSRQPTVPKDASPNGWRQGQCGTTARAAASDLDRGPLEKPVVAAMPLEGIRLERRKTRKWASSLMEAEESRFTLEDPDVQQGPAKYPQCRTRERFARILPVCIFFFNWPSSPLPSVPGGGQRGEGAWLRDSEPPRRSDGRTRARGSIGLINEAGVVMFGTHGWHPAFIRFQRCRSTKAV